MALLRFDPRPGWWNLAGSTGWLLGNQTLRPRRLFFAKSWRLQPVRKDFLSRI